MVEPKNAELYRSLFVSARDRYDSGLRRAGLLLGVAVVFHVAVFMPYIDAHQSIVNAEAQQQLLDQQFAAVTDIGTELNTVDRIVRSELPKLLESHLEHLVEDFRLLSSRLIAVQSGEGQSGTQAPREFPELQIQQPLNLAIQQPLAQIPDLPDIEAAAPVTRLPDQIVDLLRQGAPFEEIREALLPHIDTTIIKLRFDELNAAWREKAYRDLASSLSEINRLVDQGEIKIPEQATRWQSLRAATALVDKALIQYVFEPPPGNDWWLTAGVKGETINKIEEFALDSLEQGMRLAAVNQEIRSALQESLNGQEALIDEMQEQIEVAERRFAEQSAMLAELGSGFRAVALDLSFVVRWFPLLLGVLFAYVSLTLSQRLLVYMKTADALEIDDPQGRDILVPLAHNPLQNARRLLTDAGSRAIIACGWILLAGWQLSLWKEIDQIRVSLLTIAGLVIALAAQTYRYRRLKPLVDESAEDSNLRA